MVYVIILERFFFRFIFILITNWKIILIHSQRPPVIAQPIACKKILRMIQHQQVTFRENADWNEPDRRCFPIRKLFDFGVNSPNAKYIATALFFAVSILIGTLIVYLTSIKSKLSCQRIHRRTVTSIKNYESHPRSVAMDQFNNDSLLDFVVANTDLDSIDIYLGQYNGTFQYHATYFTGSHSEPCSVVAGNLDQHRGVDIAIANFGTHNILVFTGLNHGNFTLTQSFSTHSSRPLMIALADLNGDHRLEIVVLNYGTNSIGIFIASTDGYFVLSKDYSTGYDSLPNSLTIADLNNDDQLDIVVANSGTNNIGLFFGIGNGTFADQKIYSTGIGSNPVSVTIGDLNHDDYVDVVIVNSGTNNIQIFFGNEDENYVRQHKYSTGVNSRPAFVTVQDLNGDNHLDIIAVDSVNECVYILPGNENGTFPLLSVYIADSDSSPISISGADFDYDGKADLLIVNQGANNVLMLQKYGVENFMSYSSFFSDAFNSPGSIITADLNGDKVLDIIVNNMRSNSIVVFLGVGDGTFTLLTILSTGIDSPTSQLVSGDFNNDHQLDIAVLNRVNNSFSILCGYGNGHFSAATTYSTGTILDPSSFAVGDVNNDNCSDIVIVGSRSNNLGIFTGHCNGMFNFTRVYDFRDAWEPYRIMIDDFDMDKNADLVIIYDLSSVISFHFGDGTGNFSMFLVSPTSQFKDWWGMTSADFNNDNRPDLVVSGSISNEIVILFSYRDSDFDDIKSYPVDSCDFPSSIAVGDFNNDAKLDLVVCCTNSKNIAIFLGNNHGDFVQQKTYSTGQYSYPFNLVLGDFNNDHELDIAIADENNRIAILAHYYEADFAIQSKYSTGSSPQPYSLAVADFNNDNILDLVIANSGDKNIAVRLGFGNGSFGTETIYPTGPNSFPRHVNAGDLNRDGQMDIVIADSEDDSIIIVFGNGDGTFGNTSTYSMDFQSNPTWVAIGYVNNDQWLDLVVANYGTDSLGILYGYNYGNFSLHRTYSTGDGSRPRVVLIADMNNDTRLDIVVANQLLDSIGIYFGDGKGNFADELTYSTETNSHPRAMTVADMNNDGWLDMIVGNDGIGSISIILAQENGTLRRMITQTMGPGSGSSAVTVGDINNDDRLDVIVADDLRNKIHVFLGLGNGSLLSIASFSTGSNSKPSSMVLRDLDHDNCVDIVVVCRYSDSVGIFYGYGNGSFAPQIIYQLQRGAYPLSVVLSDFNDDKEFDIAVANSLSGSVEILYGLSNRSFSQPKPFWIDSMCSSMTLGVSYFDADIRPDIVVSCAKDGSFTILYGTEAGNFLIGGKHFTSTISAFQAMAYGDVNNDSHLDLVFSSYIDDRIDIFLWDGVEPFSTPVILETGYQSKPCSIAIGHFNHDDLSDIIMFDDRTNSVRLLSAAEIVSNSSRAQDDTTFDLDRYALAVGDFDNDSQLDVVVVNSVTNSVTTFQGFGNGSFEAIASHSTGTDSNPRSIAVTDFDNDHRLDLAITNAGANNVLILFGFGNGSFGNPRFYSMGYDSRPYSVTVGDFDRDGWMDMAVANFGADFVEILLQLC